MKQAIATSGGWLRLCLLYGRDKFSCYTIELTEYERLVQCSDGTEAAIVNGSCRFLKFTWAPYSALSLTRASETGGHSSILCLGRLWVEWQFTCPPRKTGSL